MTAGDDGVHRQWDPRERAPYGQLSPQPWMQWPETRVVIDALQAQGQEVRFVGGCVRDALLKRMPADIDIATPDPPQTVTALLEAAGVKVIPTGIDHGTVTAVLGDRHFEITTLRQDIETFGRHATVRWSSDWMADAARRDFTINAMSADPTGAVYDYFDGLDHLAHGRVIFIGRAAERIREDYLRILRFFRFHARYGRPPIDADGLYACRAAAAHLAELSAERVRQELLGILATDAAADMLLEMRGAGVLDVVLPEAQVIGRLRQLVFLETRGLRLDGLEPDPLRRLGAVLNGGPQVALRVAQRLKMSNAQRDRLVRMADLGLAPPPTLPQPQWRGLLRRLGRETTVDVVLIAWAGRRAAEGRINSSETAAVIAQLEEALTWQPPTFPVRGGDLIALGLPKGPAVGQMYAELEQWWEGLGCTPDRDSVLAEAQRRLDAGNRR